MEATAPAVGKAILVVASGWSVVLAGRVIEGITRGRPDPLAQPVGELWDLFGPAAAFYLGAATGILAAVGLLVML